MNVKNMYTEVFITNKIPTTMRQFIFILCLSAIVQVSFAQIEMSKFAVDCGIGTQEFNAIG